MSGLRGLPHNQFLHHHSHLARRAHHHLLHRKLPLLPSNTSTVTTADIFDGYGSYPEQLQNSPVFKVGQGVAVRRGLG